MFFTAQDVVEYLFASVGGGAQDGEHRAVREAVFRGYQEVVSAREWRFHITEGSVTMVDGVTDYALPDDMFSMDSLIPQHRLAIATFVSPYEWKQLDVTRLALGQPMFWTVMRSQDPATFDKWRLKIAGRPSNGEVMHYTYRRKPRALRFTGYEPASRIGTVNVTGTAVEGTRTMFAPEMAGAAIRIGTSASHPEGLSGLAPYRQQHKIASVQGEAGMTLAGAATAVSSVKYAVTDILDIADHMYQAVLSCSEQWYARLQGKNVEGAIGVYQRDLRLAFEQDAIAPISGQRGATGRLGPRAFGWAGPSLPDSGG